jgi:drug/metabolite transporter (DMT)-like permease
MSRPGAFAALLAVGLGWGLTTPLVKLAVEAGHRPFGIMLWQMAIAVGVLAALLRLRRGGAGPEARREPLIPLGPPELRLYAAVAALGMVLPHFFSYTAMAHLPAGVVSIIVSMVPIFTLPLALALGMERFRVLRLLGLTMGAAAMVLLIAPAAGAEADAPGTLAASFVLVAMLTPLCYALEGAYVAGRASRRAGPLQTLLGASLIGFALVLPLALTTGQAVSPFAPWSRAEAAMALAGLISVLAYSGYVALLRATGAVFAAQVSYLVTGGGIVWAMVLLGERYSGWVWAALALLFAGLFLVQPRPTLPPAAPAPAREA